MNVKELINKLQQLNSETNVIVKIGKYGFGEAHNVRVGCYDRSFGSWDDDDIDSQYDSVLVSD